METERGIDPPGARVDPRGAWCTEDFGRFQPEVGGVSWSARRASGMRGSRAAVAAP